MKVGKYQIGRYHAIIKKIYEDGSINYETSFSSNSDLNESVRAIRQFIGEPVGISILKSCIVIRGKENIIKELQ